MKLVMLERKNIVRTGLSSFKTYYIAIVIKIVWDRHTDQWNIIENHTNMVN